MAKIGQMLPPMAAPSNPKMMIHHSLAVEPENSVQRYLRNILVPLLLLLL